MQRGDWQRAESLFAGAVVSCPTDERARGHYAETLWHRGASDDALVQMQEAVRLSAGDPVLLVRLGEMYLAQGDLQNAWRLAESAIGVQPKLATAWALRADVERRRNNFVDALASYHRALGYQPNYSRVQLAVAWLYHEQGRPQRALATLENLSDQFAPGQEPEEVLYLRGLAFSALGRYEDAADSLIAASRRGQPTAEMLCHLAAAELLAGRPVGAELAVQEALRIQPRHQMSQQLRVRIAEVRQRMAAALVR